MRPEVLDAAEASGFETGTAGSSYWISPCPACGDEHRHTKSRDKRGAVGVSSDGRARCFQCEAGITTRDFDGVPRPAQQEKGSYLPQDLLEQTLASHRQADEEHVLLARRGWQAAADKMHLLVPDETSDVLVLPLLDHHGTCRSYVSRSLDPTAKIKSRSPTGYTRNGLVMANYAAVDWLRRGGPLPDRTLLLMEGETDLIAISSVCELAAIAIVSGSWTQDWARKLGSYAGLRLLVMTDFDKQGDRYAEQVAASLSDARKAGRIEVYRWSPSGPEGWDGNDFADWLEASV